MLIQVSDSEGVGEGAGEGAGGGVGEGAGKGAGKGLCPALRFLIQITVFLGLFRWGHAGIGRRIRCREALLSSHIPHPNHGVLGLLR